MASFKAKFPVLQELFAKNHRGGPLPPPPSGARVNSELLQFLYFVSTVGSMLSMRRVGTFPQKIVPFNELLSLYQEAFSLSLPLVTNSLEVFMGQIFSPKSNPPHLVGSKSIPPQIQKLMGHPSQPI